MRHIYIVIVILVSSCFGYIELSDSISNIAVRIDSDDGYFGIGECWLNNPITFEFSDPSYYGPSSNFTVQAGDEIYSWFPVDAATYYLELLPHSVEHCDSNTITTWELPDGNTIRIKINLLESAAQIEMTYINNSSSNISVQVESKYDLQIGILGVVPYSSIPVFTHITDTCAYWHSDDIPDSIYLFDGVSTQPVAFITNIESYDNPVYISYGERDEIIPSAFEIDEDICGGHYSRTAYLSGWDETIVFPGDSISRGNIIGTYGEWSSIKRKDNPHQVAIEIYPNPFNSSCKILHSNPDYGISIYDYSGKLVRIIYNNEWDGTNLSGIKMPSGIYFIKANGINSNTAKVLLIR